MADDQPKPAQIDENDKFAFGKNWAKFLKGINEQTISSAEESLRTLLQVENLHSLCFIDAGSGSGLISLAAYNLGATVTSFDADADSVACTKHLQSRVIEPDRWTVAEGSLLDSEFLSSLSRSDIVYCWGVAHHTGDLWRAWRI